MRIIWTLLLLFISPPEFGISSVCETIRGGLPHQALSNHREHLASLTPRRHVITVWQPRGSAPILRLRGGLFRPFLFCTRCFGFGREAGVDALHEGNDTSSSAKHIKRHSTDEANDAFGSKQQLTSAEWDAIYGTGLGEEQQVGDDTHLYNGDTTAPTIKEGWLFKKDHGLLPAWQRRFVSLRHGCLTYFDAAKGAGGDLGRDIPLLDCTVEEKAEYSALHGMRYEHAFVVHLTPHAMAAGSLLLFALGASSEGGGAGGGFR